MIIFCITCREPILQTSPQLVLGGKYTGDMFCALKDFPRYADDFNFAEWVADGNLWCPRCSQNFITVDGCLLTEHGKVRFGQQSIDKSVFATHKHGVLSGMLKSPDIWSQEKIEPKPASISKPKSKSKLKSKPKSKSKTTSKPKSTLKPKSFPCPICGKENKSKSKLTVHIWDAHQT